MKINVLGTEYSVDVMSPEANQYLTSNDCDGYCDSSNRQIVVSTCPKSDLNDVESYIKCVKRHEIIHAFMNESGLQSSWQHQQFGQEETTVDWIAIQFPKLLQAFKEADCM